MKKHQTFKAELNSLSKILSWVCDELQKAQLNKKEIKKIQVALEEAIVNIIQYAYDGKNGLIQVFFKLEKDYVELVLEDQGIAFNPLKQKYTDNVSDNLDERKIGGLGILFMHKLMDELTYSRVSGTNTLKLKKKF